MKDSNTAALLYLFQINKDSEDTQTGMAKIQSKVKCFCELKEKR